MDPDSDHHAVEQAMLVSASFEMWRRRHCRVPLYIPPAARSIAPRPLTQCARDFCDLKPRRKTEYVRESVYRQLDSSHPYRGMFSRDPANKLKSRSLDERPELDPLRSHVAIEFENDISTVTVSAVFENVSSQDATCILDNAKPKNWRRAAPHFFTDIRWGEFKGGVLLDCAESLAAHGEKGNGATRSLNEDHYQIEEFVEWHWKPEMTGGAITILDIKMGFEKALEKRKGNETSQEKFIDAIVRRVKDENKEDNPEVIRKAFRPNELPSGVVTTAYSYELLRCEQTKLISSWEVGGLDVDDGTYIGVWVPPAIDRTGTLFVEATKSIRYSLQADLFAGFSQILNMLAPTVESTIMNQLAYEGTLRFLKKSAELNGQGKCEDILKAVNDELEKELS